MRRRRLQVICRVLTLLSMALLLVRAGAAVAAAPEYIWVVVDDDTSLLLSNFDENHVLLLGEVSDVSPERGRPRYELFLYWGSDWRTEPAKYGEVSAGNLSATSQRGYLYPASRGQPALLVLESPQSVRILSDSALALLEDRGIPMAIPDEVSRASGDGIMRGAVLVIIVIVAGAAAIGLPAAFSRRRHRRGISAQAHEE